MAKRPKNVIIYKLICLSTNYSLIPIIQLCRNKKWYLVIFMRCPPTSSLSGLANIFSCVPRSIVLLKTLSHKLFSVFLWVTGCPSPNVTVFPDEQCRTDRHVQHASSVLPCACHQTAERVLNISSGWHARTQLVSLAFSIFKKTHLASLECRCVTVLVFHSGRVCEVNI